MSEELINLVPKMTSNTSPSGEAFASSQYSSGRAAYKAFDESYVSSNDLWLSTAADSHPRHVGYKFEKPTLVSGYRITARNDTTNDRRNPKSWGFQGSFDGDEYVTLDSYTKEHWEKGEELLRNFKNKETYQYYRLLITENIGEGATSVQELEMFDTTVTQYFLVSDNQYVTISGGAIELSTAKTEISLPIQLDEEYLYAGQTTTLFDFLRGRNENKIVTCTDDNEVNISKLHTTQELNLLQDDLLQAEEIEVLNWFENEESTELAVQGELSSKFTHIADLKNSSQIGKVVATDNNLGTKYLVSLDKEEWKRWNGTSWESVSWSNKDEINSLGMSKNTLKDITEEQWNLLGEEFYLGLYLNDHDSIIKQIDFQELIPNETPKIESGKLYILNTMAAIDVQLTGNKIFGDISDDDDNKVQYRITLNGEPILPATGDFTDLHPQPQHINFRIPSEKIKMDDLNHLVIEFQDVWGSTDTWQESFIGTLSGLLFYDEAGELYSDDVGNIQKMLDFGIVLAGQFSEPQKITLHNTLGHPVKDVKIYTDWGEEGKPQGTSMGYSPNDSPFTSTETISPTLPMDDQEEFDFHVRLETDLHATDDVIGEMKICVSATEITDEEYEKLLEENGIE